MLLVFGEAFEIVRSEIYKRLKLNLLFTFLINII